MASIELFLSEGEWETFLSFREHAEKLFGVDISRKDESICDSSSAEEVPFSPVVPLVTTHENTTNNDLSIFGNIANNDKYIVRPPPVIVHVQSDISSNSLSNLELCRKFSIACCPSNPDFKLITITPEDLKVSEMVKAHLPGIQKSTAALINFYSDSPDITVQGHHSCVDLAQHYIDRITQSLKATATLKTLSCDQIDLSSIPYTSTPAGSDSAHLKEKSSNIEILNCHNILSDRKSPQTTSNMVASPARSDDSVFSSENTDHCNQCEDVYNFSDLSNLMIEGNYVHTIPTSLAYNTSCDGPPFQAHKETHQDVTCASSNNEEEKILADSRFSKRIDQGTKLGYSEKHVVEILKRLGVNSSMEDMMRELVSEPQGVGEDNTALQSEEFDSQETNLSVIDSDDSEGFDVNDVSNLRHIIIDGSNVAMSHGQKVFSCLGIKIVVDWFKNRGHKDITVFVPQWRKEASRPDAPITNQEILTELEEERIVVFTPSRRVGGTRIVCYDDRFVLQLAVQKDGIVVSNDVYRDLVRERDDFRQVVEKRLLMYSFVQDTFMPPEDPLGRQGPSLDNFLRIKPSEPKNKPENCPYGKKCTYGNKCRYYHPERRYSSQKMVAEKLKENAELKLRSSKDIKSIEAVSDKVKQQKQKLVRTASLLPKEEVTNVVFDGSPRDKTEKPPLHHSKSLVYPNSYLTDLRLKMEQAESTDISQQPSLKTIPWSCEAVNSDQMQTTVMGMKEGSVTRKPSSPSPCASPSVSVSSAKPPLNIPANEPQDRYLSGHLLVAKKLSDEDNNSGNFFSQHTSRALGSPQMESQNIKCDEYLLSSDSNISLASPTVQVSMAHQGESGHEFNSQNNGRCIYFPSEVATPVDINEMVGENRRLVSPTNSFLPQNREENPPLSSPSFLNIPRSEQFNSCPTFSQTDDVYELPQQQVFKRSMSTTTPLHPGQSVKPSSHTFRKYSLNTINTQPIEHTHAKAKPHSSMPLNQISYNQNYTNVPHFQPQLQRNRYSLDSGISSGGIISGEQLNTSAHFPLSPTDNFSFPISSTNTSSNYTSTAPNPAQFVLQQQHHQPDTAYNSSPGGFSSLSSPWQFSPLPNRMIAPFQGQRPTNAMPPNMASVPQTQYHPVYSKSYSPSPQAVNTVPQYNNFNMAPPPNQPYTQTAYTPAMTNAECQYYPTSMQGPASPVPYSPSAPLSPFGQQVLSFQPQSKAVDEEAAISVEDPRYTLYYHMSSIFGERVVRTFMNRNPDVKNLKVKELYSLLSAYKQNTGM